MSKKYASVSEELKSMFDSDQADRASYAAFRKDKAAWDRDDERLKRAKEIHADFKAEKIKLAADDLYHLAMIFQHGERADIPIAFELAARAGQAGSKEGLYLSALAEDRYLVMSGKKQKWGSQFNQAAGGKWQRMAMQSDKESGITDSMRKEKGVPPRRQQLRLFLKRSDF